MTELTEITIVKETLEELYLEKKNSAIQIAKKFGVGRTAIYNKLLKNNIKIRSKSEAVKLYWDNLEDHSVRSFKHTPEQIEKMCKYQNKPESIKRKKRQANHLNSIEMISKRVKIIKEKFNDPIYREYRSNIIKKSYTQERKDRISKKLKGKPKTEDHKRKISIGHKGLEHTKETKKKMSEFHLRPETIIKYRLLMEKKWEDPEYRKQNTGLNHSCWINGDSFKPYTYFFNTALKKKILKRDNFRCHFPNCQRKEDLCVHHIDFNKKNCTPINLLTLCRKHNIKINYNRKYWKLYFKKLNFQRLGIKNSLEPFLEVYCY